MKNLNQDSQCLGPDLNNGTPEYEAGVLNTRPRRSVIYNAPEQRIFLYNSYVKNPINRVKEGFTMKCPAVHFPPSSTIFKLVKNWDQLGLS
jgi:hypothetical protein